MGNTPSSTSTRYQRKNSGSPQTLFIIYTPKEYSDTTRIETFIVANGLEKTTSIYNELDKTLQPLLQENDITFPEDEFDIESFLLEIRRARDNVASEIVQIVKDHLFSQYSI